MDAVIVPKVAETSSSRLEEICGGPSMSKGDEDDQFRGRQDLCPECAQRARKSTGSRVSALAIEWKTQDSPTSVPAVERKTSFRG